MCCRMIPWKWRCAGFCRMSGKKGRYARDCRGGGNTSGDGHGDLGSSGVVIGEPVCEFFLKSPLSLPHVHTSIRPHVHTSTSPSRQHHLQVHIYIHFTSTSHHLYVSISTPRLLHLYNQPPATSSHFKVLLSLSTFPLPL